MEAYGKLFYFDKDGFKAGFQKFWIQEHGRPDHTENPDRTWSGFLVRDLLVRSVVRIFSGPVRGPGFGPNCNLVQYVVRIFGPENP